MIKKIGIFKLIFPAVIGFGILFTSCMKDDDHYSIGDFIVTLGTIETKSTALNDYVIHLDHGDMVVPLSTQVPWFEIRNNQRVLVNFNPLSDEKLTDSTVTYIAKINGLKDILYKGIKKSKTGGILNIDLKYFTQGSVHYINLIDNGEANGIDKPFILELRHNARGDRKEYLVTGFVSFNLDYLKLAGKHETSFYIRYTDYEGRRIDIPNTYKY